MKPLLSILLCIPILMSGCNNTTSVDLLVFGGTIHIMDENNSTVEAMAVKNGRVLDIGDYDRLTSSYRAADSLDLNQQHVFPGFIDAHCHLFGLGEQEMIIDLIGTESAEDIVEKLRHAQKKADNGWIRGRGWDQNDWVDKEFPAGDMLDEAFPNRPVFLVRIDGHAAWVNTKALSIAGITASTPDPEGGKIIRERGAPTGILIDNAIELVRSHIPEAGIEQYKNGYRLASQRCLALGITGVHDMGLHSAQIAALKELIEEDELPVRITGYIGGTGAAWDSLVFTGRTTFGDDLLTLAGLKLYADGALGSRGALLLSPYSDDPDNHGVQISTTSHIAEQTRRALAAGLQVCVHAIGDSAVRLTLDAFENALNGENADDNALRIEHTQVIAPDDLPRFAQMGIVPSMQPTHCTSDMYWAEARLGPVRVLHSYPWQTLLHSGCLLPFGSDFPVEHPDPLAGIYAACTRKDQLGRPASASDIEAHFSLPPASSVREEQYQNGWYGSERVGRFDAMKGFTSSAASAGRQDGILGSLQPGKYADFVITNIDLIDCKEEALLSRPVVATYVGGKLKSQAQ